MKKIALLRVLCVIVACIALGSSPRPAFAQHGGHGGGGGFHGGGGGYRGGVGHYGYSSGHSSVGYHGGGYYVGHGGYGWHGGHWGHSHYGYGYGGGWGWSLGFGWPYWGWGYPYGYGYSPWYYAPYPYYYPQYCPPGYPCPPSGNDDPPPPSSGPKSGSYYPGKPSRPPASTPNTNSTASSVATLTSAPLLSTDRVTATATNYRVIPITTKQNPKLRPEVQSAMRALREMPPFAREREIETGRYSHFSPEERDLLRSLN